MADWKIRRNPLRRQGLILGHQGLNSALCFKCGSATTSISLRQPNASTSLSFNLFHSTAFVDPRLTIYLHLQIFLLLSNIILNLDRSFELYLYCSIKQSKRHPTMSSSATPSPKPQPSKAGSHRSSSSQHRSTPSAQKTEVRINVYDLLPPSRLSSVLWALGTSLLHSGVVLNEREYAYGGHDTAARTGVYHTRAGQAPPGGRHRATLLHGFTFLSAAEVDAVIRAASLAFLGPSYNLLSKNCNHFTSYLVERLTGRPAPGWLNRAAGIGLALPCVVPREWITPPEYDSQDGHLMAEEDDEDYDEGTAMLRRQNSDHMRAKVDDVEAEDNGGRGSNGRVRPSGSLKDTSGRKIPPSERAPVLRN